jgi:serine/threonine-protein kinase
VPEPAPHDATARESIALLSTLKRRRFRWALTSAAIVLSFLLLAALLRGHPHAASAGTDRGSLIVIPFVNVGGDSAQVYLADGISDELATTLGKICGIRVVGRSAAYQYHGRRDLDARSVGRALGAEFVVQGSVMQTNGRLRTSVQVTRTETREEVWANTYERPAGDAFAVQDEITRAIADSMRSRFSGSLGCQPSSTVQRKPDAEAYDLYLRGQYLLRRRGPGVQLAAERFDSAIARDSNFAPAYAGLSAALALFPYFANTPPSAVYGRVAAAAQHALALDSTLSEPHTALALAAMRVHAWARADSQHRKALSSDPTDPSAHHQYGRYLIYTGQLDSALAEFRRAESLDRLSAVYSAWVGYALFEQGKMQVAGAEFRRALDIDSLNMVAVAQAALVYALQGDTAAARAMTERFPNTSPWTATKAYVTGRIGNHAAARAIARAAPSDVAGAWFRETTKAYAALGMGDTALALSGFERATKADEIWMLYNSVGDRMFDPIRRAPRFQVLLRRIGLADRPFH